MRPYLLVSGDFHLGGGMDRANYALADYLAHAGHETHLIAHSVDSELAERPNIFFHPVIKPFGSDMLGEPFLDRIGRHWAAWIRARGGRVIVNGGNCNWNDVNWVHYVHAVYRPSVTGVLTKRLKALDCNGTKVHTVGIPIHWGFKGVAKQGYLANTLTPFVGDANTQTPEFKAFIVNIEKA